MGGGWGLGWDGDRGSGAGGLGGGAMGTGGWWDPPIKIRQVTHPGVTGGKGVGDHTNQDPVSEAS